jgi:hypothetical protein
LSRLSNREREREREREQAVRKEAFLGNVQSHIGIGMVSIVAQFVVRIVNG